MGKFLKFILIIQLLGSIGSIVSGLYTQPLVLLIVLPINLLVWFGLWKGTNFVINNPESKTQNIKANIVRWLLSFFFSIFTVETGVIVAFIMRFFIDRGYVQGNALAMVIVDSLGGQFGNTITGIGILLTFPIMYLIEKTLRFAKPLVPAIAFTFLWFFIIFLIGPLLQSGN